MKNKRALVAAAVVFASVFLVAAPANAWYDTGSRFCSSGYVAYTYAGGESYGATIIHQQTQGGTTHQSGLYTQAGQVRSYSAGWQNFNSSRVSQGPTRGTGCA